MQIGSPRIGGGRSLTLTHESDKPLAEQEIGASGIEFSAGEIISEEYVPELMGAKRFETFDKMRKNDAMVNATLMALDLPIRAADFFVEPVNADSAAEKEFTDLMHRNLTGGMTSTWDEFLQQATLMNAFGFMLFEKVVKEDSGVWVMKDLAPRMPKTVYQWLAGKHGEWLGIVQDAWFSGEHIVQMPDTKALWLGGQEPEIERTWSGLRKVTIPAWKMLRLTLNQEGANYEGRSVLRSAYKHWYVKDRMYRYDAIGQERQSVGVPVLTMPSLYTQGDLDNAMKTGRLMRANEASYLLEPDGFTWRILDMAANGSRSPFATIEHHNKMIAANVFAMFMTVGMSSVGTQSLATELVDMFLLSLQAEANLIADALYSGVVKPLAEINYGESFEAPTVRLNIHRDVDFTALSEALSTLAGAGLVTPDGTLEEYMRSVAGLPDKEDVEEEVGLPQPSLVPEIGGGVVTVPEVEPGEEEELRSGPTPVEAVDQIDQSVYLDESDKLVPWLRRAPEGAEKFVSLEDIKVGVDQIEERLTQRVAGWMQVTGSVLAEQIAVLSERGVTTAAIPEQESLQRLIQAGVLEAFAHGRRTVAEELKRQADRGQKIVFSQPKELAEKVPAQIVDSEKASLFLRGLSRAVRVWTVGRLMDAALEGGLSGLERGMGADFVDEQVRTQVGMLSENLLRDRVRRAVRKAFQRGRSFEVEQMRGVSNLGKVQASDLGRTLALQASETIVAFYSAILDKGICDPCMLSEGQYGPGTSGVEIGSDAYYDNMPQNPNCAGGANCRCFYSYASMDMLDRMPGLDRVSTEYRESFESMAGEVREGASLIDDGLLIGVMDDLENALILGKIDRVQMKAFSRQMEDWVGETAGSDALHDAANTLFGKKLKQWEGLSYHAPNPDYLFGAGEAFYDYSAQQYALTQSMLDAVYPSGKMTVYRGIGKKQLDGLLAAGVNVGDDVVLQTSGLSSWTTRKVVAENFAKHNNGAVLMQEIDISDVFSTPLTAAMKPSTLSGSSSPKGWAENAARWFRQEEEVVVYGQSHASTFLSLGVGGG